MALNTQSPRGSTVADPLSRRIRPRRFVAIRQAMHHRSLALGVGIIAFVVLLVVVGPFLTLNDPSTQDASAIFSPPSWEHLMGTDPLGRDVLARVLYGGRTTILASIGVVVAGGIVGTTVGLIAGYFGGAVGFVLMRFTDLLLAFPGILLALAVAAIFGPGLLNGVLAVSVVVMPVYARIVEGAVIEVRSLPYVDAAITLGSGSFHMITRHILPNIISGLIVLSTAWLGIAALGIAALGFLGLGVQPPEAEWGTILNDGRSYITIAWWITLFPGICLSLFVVGVNLIGDGLRDEIDPTLARR